MIGKIHFRMTQNDLRIFIVHTNLINRISIQHKNKIGMNYKYQESLVVHKESPISSTHFAIAKMFLSFKT